MVWEEHQVCYVPTKAIFCECNNSIVEAIFFLFPCVVVCGDFSLFSVFRGNVGSC